MGDDVCIYKVATPKHIKISSYNASITDNQKQISNI